MRHPLLNKLSIKIIGLVTLVAMTILLSYFAVQAFTETKRIAELQRLAGLVTTLFQKNIADTSTRLFFETSRLDVNPKSFGERSKKILQDYPSVLAIELRNPNGQLVDVMSRYGAKAVSHQRIRQSLPPWVLTDFDAVASGNAPKRTAVYSASLSPYFSDHASDLQFLVEEFFPLSSGRGVMVVIFNPALWFFNEQLVSQFQQSVQFRFKLETQNQALIASSDNSTLTVPEQERFVTPMTALGDGPLYLAIEKHSQFLTNATHLLEVMVVALGILIGLAGIFIFKGWREYSSALAMLRAQEQQLLDQSKFVSMGEISTILSHELNQPLATIESYSAASESLLAQETLDRPRLLKAILAIREENSRISKIIKHIRNFIVNNQTQIGELDPAQLVESLRTVLQMQAVRYNAQLIIEKRQGFVVRVDRLMLEQVILNLARNAYEAMLASPEGKRKLTITISLDSAEGLGKIDFTDTGPGISEEVGKKLFTPFFSTKTDSMGVGLSLCRSLVERYQGRLLWQNNPQGGAQFTISFRINLASI